MAALDLGRGATEGLDVGRVSAAARRGGPRRHSLRDKWSKLGTVWTGVAVDALLDGIVTEATFVLAHSYGGYSTNLPLKDVIGGKAWIAFEFDGRSLKPEHGGPARLLVPHLYFWKSAKWVRALELRDTDEPGFWEMYGYHDYGDPWQEQRYAGD